MLVGKRRWIDQIHTIYKSKLEVEVVRRIWYRIWFECLKTYQRENVVHWPYHNLIIFPFCFFFFNQYFYSCFYCQVATTVAIILIFSLLNFFFSFKSYLYFYFEGATPLAILHSRNWRNHICPWCGRQVKTIIIVVIIIAIFVIIPVVITTII